jgi:hypothetical protein
MKKLVMAAGGAIVLLTGSAQAEGNAPWCAVISMGYGNSVWDCRYHSIEHCRPSVIAGNRGFCVPNYSIAPSPRRSRSR